MAFDVDSDRKVGSPGLNLVQSDRVLLGRQVKRFKSETGRLRHIVAGLSPHRRVPVLLELTVKRLSPAGRRRDDPGQPVDS
jgi:hypothetical protein